MLIFFCCCFNVYWVLPKRVWHSYKSWEETWYLLMIPQKGFQQRWLTMNDNKACKQSKSCVYWKRDVAIPFYCHFKRISILGCLGNIINEPISSLISGWLCANVSCNHGHRNTCNQSFFIFFKTLIYFPILQYTKSEHIPILNVLRSKGILFCHLFNKISFTVLEAQLWATILCITLSGQCY